MGRAYVQATYNNTIVSITDQIGNVLSFSSAGLNGFGPKSHSFAVIIVKMQSERPSHGLKDVTVYVKGVGLGREAAIRGLNANGLNVTSIKDITPIPHNGCRKPGPRRV